MLLNFNITRPTAAYLKSKLGLTPDEEEIAVFGLQMILYTIVGFLSISVVGWLLGCFYATMVVAATSYTLRLFSGGAHSGSPLTCNLVGMVVTPLLGLVAVLSTLYINHFSLLIIVILGFIPSLMINWRFAPVDSPAKPINSYKQRKKLRSISITAVFIVAGGQLLLLIIGQAYVIVIAMSLGLWWQAFFLTSAGCRFATFLDKFTRKGGVFR